MMDLITTLPNEVLHHILQDVQMTDCAALSQTCKAFYKFIQENKPLFKELYHRKLDAPPAGKDTEIDWEEELHRLVRLEKIIQYDDIEEKVKHITTVASTVDHFIKLASRKFPSQTIAHLTKLFSDTLNKEAFLSQSTIFQRAQRSTPPERTFAERQASAKLHCLYGVPILLPKRTHYSSIYPYACSVVYDMRNYTDENFWGPFMGDGKATVDWERVEAVMVVLGYNLNMFSKDTHNIFKPIWVHPFRGANAQSFDPMTVTKRAVPAGPKEENDPYNISGTWMRVVCFLDFHDLHHYNFSHDPGANVPRPPIDTTEAIRLIIMELTVTSICAAGTPEGPGPNDDPAWPVVYFTGLSRSMHASFDPNANSNIRGRVSVTLGGEVRWTTWSIYWGEERWKSESIQIGGMNSLRGVFGHWFDKNLSDEGPAGPTAFWKISNEIDEDGAHRDDSEEEDLDFLGEDGDDDDEEDFEEVHIHLPATLVLVGEEEMEVMGSLG